MQAKVKLLRNIGSLHSTVDAALHWCVVLVAAVLRALQLPADTLKLTGVLLTGKADVNSVGTGGDVVQFAAGEGIICFVLHCWCTSVLFLVPLQNVGL